MFRFISINISKLSLPKMLFGLSGLLTLSLIASGVSNIWIARKITGHLSSIVDQHLPCVRLMTLADMMHDGLRAVVYRAVISTHASDKGEAEAVKVEYQEMSQNFRNYLDGIEKLQIPDATRKAIAEARPSMQSYIESAGKIVEAAAAGNKSEVESMVPAFQKEFEELEGKMAKLGELIESDAESEKKEAIDFSNSTEKLGLVLIILCALFNVAVAFAIIRLVNRNLKNQINEIEHQSKKLADSSTSMLSSSKNLALSSTQQSSAIQRTASSLEEMNAMVKKSAENSKQSTQLAQTSYEIVTGGKQSVDRMISAMDEINKVTSSISIQIDESNKQIEEIVSVITEIGNKTKVINDIVFQTKLLSFNASVEAARAGEHGKGFAVVAEEVGNLAQMSGNASKEIADMLSASIERVRNIVSESGQKIQQLIVEAKEKVKEGEAVTGDCAEVFNRVVDNTKQINQMVSEISSAMAEQSQGVSEITKAMNQLDQAIHSNAGVSNDVAHSAETVSSLTDLFADVVTALNKIVDGHSAVETLSVIDLNAEENKISLQGFGHQASNTSDNFKKIEKTSVRSIS